jgi:hypothetical protein
MFKHSGKANCIRCYKQHVPSTTFSETSNTYLTVARIFPQIKEFLKENKYASKISDLVHISQMSKGKAILLQSWTGPEGSRRLRLPVFWIIGA